MEDSKYNVFVHTDETHPYKCNIIKDAADKRLHIKCKKVKEPHSNGTWAIIDAMKTQIKNVGAVGIAAPQIGINRRIIVVFNNISYTLDEFINPEILEAHETDENMRWEVEGCLSHPGLFAEIARPNHIVFKAQRLQDSSPKIFHAAGDISRYVQHELDHINGTLFTDLGIRFRNPEFPLVGQAILRGAMQEREEHGQQDWIKD